LVRDFTLRSAPTFLLITFFAGAARGMADGFVLVAIVLGSVLAHEMAHALAARRLGVPVHNITLTWYGGYAEFVMRPSTRLSEILIAAAGPVSNLAIAAVAFPLLHFVTMQSSAHLANSNILMRIEAPQLLERSVEELAWTNLSFGVFNLLPGLPLDGGHIASAMLNRWMSRGRANWLAAWAGVVVGVATILFGFMAKNLWSILIGISIAMSAWGYKRALRYGA